MVDLALHLPTRMVHLALRFLHHLVDLALRFSRPSGAFPRRLLREGKPFVGCGPPGQAIPAKYLYQIVLLAKHGCFFENRLRLEDGGHRKWA